ncbi:hypothetical protein [Desulfovibrio sp. JC010]|uniref:hypothetical protein n=1 Tax=Desulfovibrio sp. JC010 TaxID=2593641 RepID=UPI0013CF66CD|nr:hypothetical protein [Desulfovibrio sp. JC010]NDV26889.1 hypothetical protein [Desulfovibrio sp. JC010]
MGQMFLKDKPSNALSDKSKDKKDSMGALVKKHKYRKLSFSGDELVGMLSDAGDLKKHLCDDYTT